MNIFRLLQINSNSTLRESLERIDENHLGLILVNNESGSIIGLATDGDIRRKLLSNGTLDDTIGSCCNKNFVWSSTSTSREKLLKLLDKRVKFIPILDDDLKLVDYVTRDQIPISKEGQFFAQARAPVRVSFGGGGSDLTHYFSDKTGAVISGTISLYSHATLKIRSDESICIHSQDLGAKLVGSNLDDVLSLPGNFGLIQALLKSINPAFGFELFLYSDFPMKSGLGGSAVVSASILGCFNQFRHDKWNDHELAELAYQAERIYLGVEGGWQDQYATVFGGINFLEFKFDQNIIHPLRIHSDTLLELEESLVLCNTGITHDSGEIHQDRKSVV